MSAAPVEWRRTPAGRELVAKKDGQDVGNVWQTLSGRFAGYPWVDPKPTYFDTEDKAKAHVERTLAGTNGRTD